MVITCSWRHRRERDRLRDQRRTKTKSDGDGDSQGLFGAVITFPSSDDDPYSIHIRSIVNLFDPYSIHRCTNAIARIWISIWRPKICVFTSCGWWRSLCTCTGEAVKFANHVWKQTLACSSFISLWGILDILQIINFRRVRFVQICDLVGNV